MLMCNHCGLQKDENEFRRDGQRPSGFRPQCKSCKRDYDNARRPLVAAKEHARRLAKKMARNAAELTEPVDTSEAEVVSNTATLEPANEQVQVVHDVTPERIEIPNPFPGPEPEPVPEPEPDPHEAKLREDFEIKRAARLMARRERDRIRRERNRVEREAQKRADKAASSQRATHDSKVRQARVNAIKRLVMMHERDFKRLFKEERDRIGAPIQRVWTPLVDMSDPEPEVAAFESTSKVMEAV